MRQIAFILLAAAMIISCSDNGGAAFDTAPVAAVVKGSVGSGDTLAPDDPQTSGSTGFSTDDKIGITGGKYTNIPYTYREGGFQPYNTAIVFTNSNPVTFSAYYPYDENVTEGSPTISIDTSNQTADAQKKIDFLYANGAEASSARPAISFTGENAFSHAMSKVTIKFVAGSDISFESLKPTQFTLSGIKLKGTFDTGNGTAESGNDATASALTVAIPSETLESSLILIPQTVEDGAEIKVTFNSNDYTGTLSNSAADTSLPLQPGHEYRFTVTISNKDLEITAKVESWNKTNPTDIDAIMGGGE